jgi:hypothetical protein
VEEDDGKEGGCKSFEKEAEHRTDAVEEEGEEVKSAVG